MSPRGRPKKIKSSVGRSFSARIEPELLREFRAYANAEGITITRAITFAIREFLKNPPKLKRK